MQQNAFAWMINLLGPLEGRARELRGRTRGNLGVMVLDLRVRRGADPPPDARVLAEAQMFSRARPRSIVSHMEAIGYPVSFAEPQVREIMSKCAKREEDTTVICCVGDKVPPRGGRLPPNFNHTFISTCFDQLTELRSDMAAPETTDKPEPRRTREDRRACGFCGQVEKKMMSCAGCGQVRYCGRECQKQAWPRHKQDCKKYRKVAADVDAINQKLTEDLDTIKISCTGKDVAKHLSGAGLDAMITPENAAAFQVKLKQFIQVVVEPGTLSKMVWEQRGKHRAGKMGDPAVVKIFCIIDRGDFDDWLVRQWKSMELVGRACSGLQMTLLDEDNVRVMRGEGVEANWDAIVSQFRNPDFDPREAFICNFNDPSCGPYADAMLRIPWNYRLKLDLPSEDGN